MTATVQSPRPASAASDSVARGKAARAAAPRSSHTEFAPAGDRSDPIELLERQAAATRVPELVPIRYGRMLASPFAFYRGAATIMAEDLASARRRADRTLARAVVAMGL